MPNTAKDTILQTLRFKTTTSFFNPESINQQQKNESISIKINNSSYSKKVKKKLILEK